MNPTAPLPSELHAAAPVLAGRLGAIVAALAAFIAHAFLKNPRRAVLIVPLWTYLNHTARRFARLMDRLAAGKTARPRPTQAATSCRDRPSPRLRLPQGRAWLATDIGWQGRGYGSQLEHLLNTPEAADLLAHSPQAQRLLRPLCRMLGITPAALPPLPPRVRKPRPKREPKPRRLSRKQREAILWYPNMEGRPMKLLPPRKYRA
jgi:hypothetical protein